ncbi:MAG: polyamine aminopropyltransferase [Bdellovibrio sp.]|nr:polyamine aminopropyltransferase [Bdellovibrio sp.]
MNLFYFFSVFIVATCGLIYELVVGAIASYLLGDSVTQFSTVIGTYLFAMGVGSFLSKFVTKRLVHTFIKVEILIGLFGGFSATILFAMFDHVSSFRTLLYSVIMIIGILVGVEIPLVMKILKDRIEFNKLVSHVFSFDYIGALLASLAFPLILVPYLGLIRTSFLFGMLNVGVALMTLILFKGETRGSRSLVGFSIISLLVLTVGFVFSERITQFTEQMAYNDQVIYSHSTHYQRILITKNPHELKLFLNGNLQFSSRDEYRYHEPLVHTGLASLKDPKKVLILGGGDGLAVREVLKYPSVEKILLVDLDDKMTQIFKTNDLLTALNQKSLTNPKVEVLNGDAFEWAKSTFEKFDFVIVDFPDPTNFSLGKLYTQKFYASLASHLTENGLLVVQSTSPFVARKSFWCIAETIQAAGFKTYPYHVYVPSFGEWGFVIASLDKDYKQPESYPADLKFVNAKVSDDMFNFPPDMAYLKVDVNKLNNQALVKYFEDEWAHYTH